MFNFSYPQVVLAEVPDEISMAFSISGCPLRCKNCHSQETWDKNFGKPLTKELFEKYIQQKYITCVLFYGGEWDIDYLIELLKIARNKGLKTCLYTGLEIDELDKKLLQYLNYLKTGRYIEKLGALESKNTNQKFINLDTNEDLTYKFFKE